MKIRLSCMPCAVEVPVLLCVYCVMGWKCLRWPFLNFLVTPTQCGLSENAPTVILILCCAHRACHIVARAWATGGWTIVQTPVFLLFSG